MQTTKCHLFFVMKSPDHPYSAPGEPRIEPVTTTMVFTADLPDCVIKRHAHIVRDEKKGDPYIVHRVEYDITSRTVRLYMFEKHHPDRQREQIQRMKAWGWVHLSTLPQKSGGA